MDTLARRLTEPQISVAIALGWRIAKLYNLRTDELPTAPPKGVLPVRASFPAAEHLMLELRTVEGSADRLGAGTPPEYLNEALGLAEHAADSAVAEEAFRECVRAWHMGLETMLWADHDATGKAYDLGTLIADAGIPENLAPRRSGEPAELAMKELRRIFAPERVALIRGLLDDLQTRIDPAAVQIVDAHLSRWRAAVETAGVVLSENPRLQPLERQTVTWCQLLTGDKEPEAFTDHQDRVRVRDSMLARVLRSYGRGWRAVLVVATSIAGLVLAILAATANVTDYGGIIGIAGSLAGVLGLSVTAMARTIRKSLSARGGQLWNTALVEVISQKTLRSDDLLPSPSHRSRMGVFRRGWAAKASAPSDPLRSVGAHQRD